MAFIPFQIIDPMDSLDRSYREFQRNMANSMAMGDMAVPVVNLAQSQAQAGYCRPWRNFPDQQCGFTNVKVDKERIKIELDVKHFTPEELSVKTVDNQVVVEGKHEEKEDDHGFVSRNFVRRYPIPEGVKPESITSSLSSDGILTISSPEVKAKPAENERSVPITATGVPASKKTTTESHKPTQEEESKK